MIKGAQIQTKESFLYGRFETMIKPAYGSAVISSFFLFNDKLGFQTKWNEIDFEILGQNTNAIDTNFIRTVNGHTDKNVNVKRHAVGKRCADVFWKLSIDWAPERIIWSVNDTIIRTAVVNLNIRQKLMMNIWVSDSEGWAGEFNPGILPQQSEYKYIRYSSYENGRLVFKWQDDFNTIDTARWQIGDWELQGTKFVKENVQMNSGSIILKLT